jgi:hypothetical protein
LERRGALDSLDASLSKGLLQYVGSAKSSALCFRGLWSLRIVLKAVEQVDEFRADSLKFFVMDVGEASEEIFAGGRQFDKDLAAIFRGTAANDPSFFDEAIDQADGAVVPKLKALGQFADGHLSTPWKALDGKQCLMLLRGNSFRFGGFLAESQEASQGVAKRCKRFVVRFRERVGFTAWHDLSTEAPKHVTVLVSCLIPYLFIEYCQAFIEKDSFHFSGGSRLGHDSVLSNYLCSNILRRYFTRFNFGVWVKRTFCWKNARGVVQGALEAGAAYSESGRKIMKRLLLTMGCGLAGCIIAGCASDQQNYAPDEATYRDPAGVMINTNTAGPENQARGLYQEPYAGPLHYATPSNPFPDDRP